MMFLESPALTAPKAEWEAWRDKLMGMNRRDPSVEFALRRAEIALANFDEPAVPAHGYQAPAHPLHA